MINFKNVTKHLATRTHEAMMPVLMNPVAAGPAIHYYMIRGGRAQGNVTVWEPGTVGGEYIKAFGHYHVDDLPETYWIASGVGIALLQKLEGDDPAVVSEFKVIHAKAGDKLDIPIGYGHLMINVGNTFLVTTDDSPIDFGDGDSSAYPNHAEYERVKQMQGFAYYVVEHEGKPALMRNLKYKSVVREDLAGLEVIRN